MFYDKSSGRAKEAAKSKDSGVPRASPLRAVCMLLKKWSQNKPTPLFSMLNPMAGNKH